MVNKEFFTVAELAGLMGISRIAVFKQIKAGKIKAEKIGRNYVVRKKDLPISLSAELTAGQKREITRAVSKVVSEYEVTLRKLGQE